MGYGNIRVVVTGAGVISSLGTGVNTFWKNLQAGRSGISRVQSFNTKDSRTHIAGEVKGFTPGKFMKRPGDKGRASQFLLAAVKLAVKDARISAQRLGSPETSLLIGTTALEPNVIEEISRIQVAKGLDKVSPYLITKGAINTPPKVVARELGIQGRVLAIPTACSAGNYSIGYGFDLIKQRKANIAVCCGVDVFFRAIFEGFNRMLLLAPDKCRPFDRKRKGTIIGEGAGVLVLETLESALTRKAGIYAEVLGYGLSCDAHSMTISTKDGMKKVMRRALKNSRVRRDEVDYINAHGTGTVNNDKNEIRAIKEVFGSRAGRIPITSIKSMLGHTIGAASALEAASCCLTIRDGIIPPTINFHTPDPECKANIIANKAKRKTVDIVMNNAFAFGGNNACVLFGRLKKRRRR